MFEDQDPNFQKNLKALKEAVDKLDGNTLKGRKLGVLNKVKIAFANIEKIPQAEQIKIIVA